MAVIIIIPALIADLHRAETSDRRADLRRRERIRSWQTSRSRSWSSATAPCEVVHGIDLDIADHEFVVLVGPSGCGKSTTLRMIAGLEDISGGDGRDRRPVVNDLPPRERNISHGVPELRALSAHERAREPGLLAEDRRAAAGRDRPSASTRRREILGLTPCWTARPAQLSGGQRQRVAMGRAIVRHPDVFLFDEPLSNLDAKLRGQMRAEIKKLHQKVQSTVVYVTHDQVEAMTLADRIVIMRDGHIEQVGTPMEVFNRPGHHLRRQLHRLAADEPGARRRSTAARCVLPMATALPVPRAVRRPTCATARRCIFGIRPDDIFPIGHGLLPATAPRCRAAT